MNSGKIAHFSRVWVRRLNYSARVKICGVTTPEAARHAAQAGADAIGLMFYAESPRYIDDLARARAIAQAAGPLVAVVGLFVNANAAWVNEVLQAVPLSVLQFHGDEPEEFCQAFARPYLKALRMKPGLDVEAEAARYASAQGVLLDAYKPGVPGGTGETFAWDRVPKRLAATIVLAGGLTPANVADAVRTVRPWAVDVSGGVEAAPGTKAPDLVEQFIRNAKQAFA